MDVSIDLNLVVLCGRLAVDAEPRVFDSGSRQIRYLVTVRSDAPRRRSDVIPVTLWDPPEDLFETPGEKNQRVWVCGSVQKRYRESPDGRRSGLEVIAEQVTIEGVEELEPVALA